MSFHACHGDLPDDDAHRHPPEHRSSRHGRSNCQWMMRRGPHTKCHLPRLSGHGSRRCTSQFNLWKIEPTDTPDRAGPFRSPAWILWVPELDSFPGGLHRMSGGHRGGGGWGGVFFFFWESFDACLPRLEGHVGGLVALPIDDAIYDHRCLEVTATHNRVPAMASVTARRRRLLRDLRRDRARASYRCRSPTRVRGPPSLRSSREPAFSIARDGALADPSRTRSGSEARFSRRTARCVACPRSKPGDPGMQAYKFEMGGE